MDRIRGQTVNSGGGDRSFSIIDSTGTILQGGEAAVEGNPQGAPPP